ncbi:MAG: riboflavin kinase [Deltaproteobacteria bacterium]|nr:riboflavin kinase [Deltaproteobacteria bacterium]
MQLHRHLADVPAAVVGRPRVVAVGEFDAIHLGHRAVLARLVDRAARDGGEAVVALRPPATPSITSLRRRLAVLTALRVDRVVHLGRARIADEILLARLGAVCAVTGAEGVSPSGGALEVVAPIRVDGARIDSDGIRRALQAGDLAAVRARLGGDQSVDGRVVHGFHRGAPLGVPTANLRIRDVVLPADGVYAVRARVVGRALHGVANIGFNPTFGNRVRSVETHLFDFHSDIYGRRLELTFVARLRGEQKFAGIDALLAQIRSDIATARALLGSPAHGG